MHKKYNLAKPFTIAATDGYVLDVPIYEGSKNDADILKNIVDNNVDFNNLLREGDIFIMDRGFRDVVNHLKEKGFKYLMPALKGNRKQLPTNEANESRFVTKVRWPVEATHGVIGQKFKLLHNVFLNKSLNRLEPYVRTANYLYNEYCKRFASDLQMADEIISRMKLRKNLVNTLAEEVEAGRYNRRPSLFTSLKAADFPKLELDELKLFFMGTYQLSQGICYLAELIDEEDNSFDIKYLKENQNILMFEVQSRHKKKTIYKCCIDYISGHDNIDGISRYCCSCANGLRTVGSCCHIAAIVFYLSYSRYFEIIMRPASFLNNLFLNQDIIPVINDDSDEED